MSEPRTDRLTDEEKRLLAQRRRRAIRTERARIMAWPAPTLHAWLRVIWRSLTIAVACAVCAFGVIYCALIVYSMARNGG